ncbi:MAG TPA: transposase, partial [Candidatus Acidoferrales bacterium]|nr:transposase [Candidatus Acidoferrales bacterium]
ARTGPLWLKNPRVAETLLTALHTAPSRRLFRLAAYAIMANHVHILLTPLAPIGEITRQIKGATARHANLILQRTGLPFWQDESFDHWVRNAGEWQKIRAYIERNPVAAGLVAKPEDWPWSSAAKVGQQQ